MGYGVNFYKSDSFYVKVSEKDQFQSLDTQARVMHVISCSDQWKSRSALPGKSADCGPRKAAAARYCSEKTKPSRQTDLVGTACMQGKEILVLPPIHNTLH
jgi:hypothetical protein